MPQNNRTGKKPGEENNPGQAGGEADDEDQDEGDEGDEGEGDAGNENAGDEAAAGERAAPRRARREQPAPAPAVRAAPAAAAPVIDQAAIDLAVQRGVEADRQRSAQIRALGGTTGLSQSFVDQHANGRTSVAEFRSLALDELVRVQSETGSFPHVSTRGMQDETDTRRAAVTNAILHRGGQVDTLTDAAREWRGMSAMDIAKELLRANNESTRGSVNEIALRAFHTTTDFPTILGNVADTTLMRGYDTVRAENTFQLFANRNVLPDFRDASVFELGAAPDLLPVNEHGEFRRGTMKESGERFALGTFGRIVGFTRQMLINDQLGAFMNAVNSWGGKVAKLEGDVVWSVIINNAILKDGSGIFGTARGNQAATGTYLTQAAVLDARKAMRKFKDIDGEQISIKPSYLFVGTELEIAAMQLVAAPYQPNTPASVTPEVIKSLTPVYEPRLDAVGDFAWFLFANTADAAGRGVQYAYLNGQEQPFTENRAGFDVDGMEFKIRHDFGAGVTDYRFGYKNPGAAPTP